MLPLNCSFDRILTCHQLAQLQALNNQLQVENRIKEGAENLLQMPMEVCILASVVLGTVLSALVMKGKSTLTSGGGTGDGQKQNRRYTEEDRIAYVVR